MLTGQPAFRRGSLAEGALRENEPRWHLISAGIPAGVITLLKRCLDEDQKRRRRDIGDVLVDLDAALIPDAGPGRLLGRTKWLALAGGLLLAAAAAILLRDGRQPAEQSTSSQARLSLLLPAGMDFPAEQANQLAVSPDGTMIAYVAASAGQAPRLLVRKLDASAEQIVDDALDVRHPFFSPDSRWLGFFAGDTIRKVPLAGGRSEVIAQAPRGESASWNAGVIVFGEEGDLSRHGHQARRRRRRSGGSVVHSRRDAGEINHLAPQLLPDGETVMYTVRSA